MSIAYDSLPARPSRAEIEPVAADLIQRHGPQVMGIARRYAVSPEDAEDAYQRALEILLTKAPTTDEGQLLAWLKTVVKHEAYALRKKRERDVPAEHDALDAFAGGDSHAADERAERYDRLRVGAEALGRLKPQETRCLLLRAEGLSYQEIAAHTGWTYTKVNRCLVEGRRAFVARVAGIESGAECKRMEPLLSAFADGEASADDVAALRPHLRGCSSCRAALRDYREAPVRVRDLGATALAVGLGERLWSSFAALKSLFGAAAAQKAVVVAATTAAVAGAGAVTADAVRPDPQRAPRRATAAAPSPAPVHAARAAPAAAVRSAGARAGTRRRTRPTPAAAAPSAAPTPATKPPPAGEPAQPRAAPGRAAPIRGPAAAPAPAAEPEGEFAP